MRDTQCPYCGAEVEINHDDGQGYAEDEKHQQDCPECEKTFVFTTEIILYYHPAKADCLNGAEHDWHKTKTWPQEFARLRCSICDEEMPKPANAEVSRSAPLLAQVGSTDGLGG